MDESKKYINILKILSLDMIDACKNGYPGISLGASSIIYTLFTKELNIMPSVPDWLNRDRLVLSAAHAAGLVYANMYMAGYPIDEIWRACGYKSRSSIFRVLNENNIKL